MNRQDSHQHIYGEEYGGQAREEAQDQGRAAKKLHQRDDYREKQGQRDPHPLQDPGEPLNLKTNSFWIPCTRNTIPTMIRRTVSPHPCAWATLSASMSILPLRPRSVLPHAIVYVGPRTTGWRKGLYKEF